MTASERAASASSAEPRTKSDAGHAAASASAGRAALGEPLAGDAEGQHLLAVHAAGGYRAAGLSSRRRAAVTAARGMTASTLLPSGSSTNAP